MSYLRSVIRQKTYGYLQTDFFCNKRRTLVKTRIEFIRKTNTDVTSTLTLLGCRAKLSNPS